jgi:tetratricopeptide (TPR) repeat protein
VLVLLRAQRPAQALEEGWKLMAQGGGKPGVRIGILLRLAARAEESVERYTQGFEWATELYEQGDSRLRPGALLVHGSLAYRIGRIEEAIASLKAINVKRAGAVRVGTLAFLALCFADRGEREQADAYLERAKAAHEKQTRGRPGRPEYDALLLEAAKAVESTPR